MKKYEAVFILDIRKSDDEGASFGAEFEKLIAKLGGSFEKMVNLGRKQFCYAIDKHKAGIYLDFLFELDPAKVSDIRAAFRLDERVLRNMIVVNERPEDAVCLSAVKFEAEER